MPDQIVIESLELSAHIGVPDDERLVPQRLTVNITLQPAENFSNLNDDIARTVDYFAVSKAVQALARERPRRLIETVVQEIATMILERFAVVSVELELRKFILSDTAFVAVRIRRERA